MPTVTAITGAGGTDLAPTAPSGISGAAGGNLAPSAPAGSASAASGNLSPTAPGLTGAAAGGNLSPTAPGLTSAAAGGNLSPTAPGATGSVATGGTFLSGDLLVTGTTSPSLAAVNGGRLTPQTTQLATKSIGTTSYSSDAASSGGSGATAWMSLTSQYRLTYASGTLAALFPVANYIASDTQGSSHFITIDTAFSTGVSLTSYWLYSNSGSPKWVQVGDSGLTDRGSTTIAANKGFSLFLNSVPVDPIGGLVATWIAAGNAPYIWLFMHRLNGTTRYWEGAGATPSTVATWYAILGGSSGSPIVTAEPLTATAAASSAGGNLAPSSPVGAAGVAGGNLAPTAPVGIV